MPWSLIRPSIRREADYPMWSSASHSLCTQGPNSASAIIGLSFSGTHLFRPDLRKTGRVHDLPASNRKWAVVPQIFLGKGSISRFMETGSVSSLWRQRTRMDSAIIQPPAAALRASDTWKNLVSNFLSPTCQGQRKAGHFSSVSVLEHVCFSAADQ